MDNIDDKATPTETEDQKQFTQADLDRIIKERMEKADRQRAKAVEEAVEAYKRQAQAEAKAKADAERIKNLEGEERLKAEYEVKQKALQDQLDAQRAEAEQVKRDLSLTRAQARLAELNLPASLAENVLGADDEQTSAKIDALSKAFNDAVNVRVAEGLHKGTPPAGGLSVRQAADSELDRLMGISR